MLQILQTFAFLALDSLSEPAIACACGRRLEERPQFLAGMRARISRT